MKHRLATLAVLAALSVGASAADLYVPTVQFPTIQSAVNAAMNGDTVHVAAGTYFENVFWGQTGLTLQGAGQGQTIIDGKGTGTCLTVENVDSSARIDGFTFENGHAGYQGGGVFVYTSGGPEISNCTFLNNSAQFGGGLESYGSAFTLTNCSFSGNNAFYGGAIFAWSCTPTLTGCALTSNFAQGQGGGVICYLSNANLTNCSFTQNSSSNDGGGFVGNQGNATLSGCRFTENSAGSDGGGVENLNNSTTAVNGCVFTGNTAPYQGGGMFNSGGSLAVSGCTFNLNSGAYGGALKTSGSSVTLTDSAFNNNESPDNGYPTGGAIDTYGCYETVTRCSFNGNIVQGLNSVGGAIWTIGGFLNVVDSTFAGNSAATGGGIQSMYNVTTALNCSFSANVAYTAGHGGGVEDEYYSTTTLTNCILWQDAGGEMVDDAFDGLPGSSLASATYSDVQGGTTGVGNKNSDPLYANSPDLHLLAASPCINSGSNAAVSVQTDLDGNPRIEYGTVDMGAFEASPTTMIGALNTRVKALVSSGALSAANGQHLYAKLDSALSQLHEGKNKDAIGSLNAFISQVQTYVKGGKLTSAQGQPLITSATALIVFLNPVSP